MGKILLLKKGYSVNTQEQMKKLQVNYPIGTKIIVISNEPYQHGDFNEICVGEVLAYDAITMSGQPVIIYKDERADEEFMSLSEPMYYSQELFDSLSKLTWDERWNIYSRGVSIISKEDAKRKEDALTPTPLNVKLRIQNDDEYYAIQLKCFEKRIGWNYPQFFNMEEYSPNMPFLFVGKHLTLGTLSDSEWYDNHAFKEMSVDEFMNEYI